MNKELSNINCQTIKTFYLVIDLQVAEKNDFFTFQVSDLIGSRSIIRSLWNSQNTQRAKIIIILNQSD